MNRILPLFPVVPNTHAPTGFFRSIGLRNENALQDTLRLLTLWFKFGHHDDVSMAIGNGFTSVEVDTWLEVIPQVLLVCAFKRQPCAELVTPRSSPGFKHQARTFTKISSDSLLMLGSNILRHSSMP